MSRNMDLSKTVPLVDDLDVLHRMVRDFLQLEGMRVLDKKDSPQIV